MNKYRFLELVVEAVHVDKAKGQDAELDPVGYLKYGIFVFEEIYVFVLGLVRIHEVDFTARFHLYFCL